MLSGKLHGLTLSAELGLALISDDPHLELANIIRGAEDEQ